MTIEKWLELAKKQINTLDAELILLFGMRGALPEGADRSYLFAHKEVGMSQAKWAELDKMLERRVQGEPLAYILGYKEFFGREFRVNSAVLIPRPETEQLVEMALEAIDEFSRSRVLEIGTGSGCIAATVKLERPETEVTATDVSSAALEVARENARRLGAEINFVESDLLEKVPNLGDFELILANLPYVSRDWGWVKTENLRFEPELALFAGENGLALYHSLFEQIRSLGLARGVSQQNADFLSDRKGQKKANLALKPLQIIVEADPEQQAELIALVTEMGFRHLETRGFSVRFEL